MRQRDDRSHHLIFRQTLTRGAVSHKLSDALPHATPRARFQGKPTLIESNAIRIAGLQSGAFVLAARAVELDCDSVSGSDADRLDEDSCSGTTTKANFVRSPEHGNASRPFGGNPPPAPYEACRAV
jgi:3-hydroxypropanoate dehydrogenase